MGRLRAVLLFTSDPAAQRTFWEKGIGLAPVEGPTGWSAFATARARLVVAPLGPGESTTIQHTFTTDDLDATRRTLAARGLQPEDAPPGPSGPAFSLVDPEGNRVRFVQPSSPIAQPAADAPALSHAILNCSDVATLARFYHDGLGLKVAHESPQWVEFDTGESRFVLHASADGLLPLPGDQRATFALDVDNLDAYAEALASRGLHLATAITEEEFGLYAEVEDPDGNLIVLRGPLPGPGVEEELAGQWDDGESPHEAPMRRSVGGELAGGPKPAKATKPASLARKAAAREASRGLDSLIRSRTDVGTAPRRGAGPRKGDGA